MFEGVEPDLLHVTMEALVDSNSPALPLVFLPLISIICTCHSLDVPVAAPKRRGSGASDAIPLVYLVRSVEQPVIVTEKYINFDLNGSTRSKSHYVWYTAQLSPDT